jgi:hypothetical protein
MNADTRHDRTLRLLEARLEVLASASERALRGEVRYEREIIATAAATRHAIALDLITSEEAGSVWRDVADRHPQAGWCRTGPELAA